MIRQFLRDLGMITIAVLLLLLLSMLWAHSATATKPGVERWPIKTSLSPGAQAERARTVLLTDLLQFQDPPRAKRNDHAFQSVRMPPFPNALSLKEGDLLTTTGWLHLVAAEADGDYHIQLSSRRDSQAECLIVEVPDPRPAFTKQASLRPALARVRAFVAARLLHGRAPSGSGSGSLLRTPAFVRVTGQLFYDNAHVGTPPRGKGGCHAHTLWELHPVTQMEFAHPS